jgi:signal peptidase I
LAQGKDNPNAPKRVQCDERPETRLETISSICVVLVIGLFSMSGLAQNFVIPSGSMEKTLLIGDHVLVDRMTFAPPTRWAPFVHYREPKRGDVIVFYKPNPETPDLILVKRLIGLPGDRIHLDHGVVYLNGVRQEEPYALLRQPGDDPQDWYSPSRDDFPTHGAPEGATAAWSEELASHIADGNVVVPAGTFFAMGDNRDHIADSRYWGFVPRENILGRPLFNYWSFDSGNKGLETESASIPHRLEAFLTMSIHIFDKTRWARTGHPIT